MTRIPALVVSGFLGSGKTTLVAHLLACAQAEGTRIAIVSNEIGALGIDRALLGGGGEAFIELEGGCVCCELSDDLVETMQRLYEEVRPDRIVIETSGAALPFDTQLNFWREPVSDWVGDDTAIVVVNAEQLAEERDLEGTFEDQVHSADLLVLNKVDLLDADALERAEARLREIEDEAPIVRAEHGRISPSLLFPPDAESVDRSGTAPAHPDHHHEQFATELWEVPAGTSAADIEARLADSNQLLRAKGFVEIGGELQIVQLVGRRLEIEATRLSPPRESIGTLVLISRVGAA
ncbi:MAG: GTP-binding protein [Myxococcota bacterium]|nr:GTP-binding protein [Myxococcota bacterium]